VKYGDALAIGPVYAGDGAKIYLRAVLNGRLVESKSYVRNAKRNNYVVEVRGRPGLFALVLNFCTLDNVTLLAKIQDLVDLPAPELDMCSTISKFKVADEVSYIPADDIVAGPMLTISNLGDIFIINHRPSPEAN